jgi:acyl-CoA dehydrogenase
LPLNGLEGVSYAYGLNHYEVDRPLRDVMAVYTKLRNDLSPLGKYVGTEVYEVAYRVDAESLPRLVNWGVNGERADYVWLDPHERQVVRDLMLRYGVNRYPFQGGTWHDHYAGIYLIGDPGISCILTITVQTAYALHKYAEGELREEYRRLAGIEEPLHLGATWFTEVQGGSDLGANTTTARRAEGRRYLLTGYKYFASGAGIADLALVTARPEGARGGAKGLALFAVPRLNSKGVLNYYIRRLKLKSGTNAVPTGEVELIDSEAELIGREEEGIYYTMEDLMVSRLANSVGAVGIARKAYLEALGFARERRAFGRRLIEHPLMRRDLLDMEVSIEGALALTFKAVDEFQRSLEARPPSYTRGYHYARFLTHIAKNLTAEVAARVTQLAMEAFGGIGFLTEFPVERWHREALITPIWEGTSNIQALDMLEAMVKKGAHEVYLEDMSSLVKEAHDADFARRELERARELMSWFSSLSPAEAEFNSKEFLRLLGHMTAAIMLEVLASRTGNALYDTVAKQYHRLYVERKELEMVGNADEIISIHGGA